MERSSDRTRISRRSKGACSIALVVGFGCAVFGVGGAAAGDGSYARHLREARLEAKLAGAALAHRTPEQLLLAVTPKPHTATATRADPDRRHARADRHHARADRHHARADRHRSGHDVDHAGRDRDHAGGACAHPDSLKYDFDPGRPDPEQRRNDEPAGR